MRSPNLVIRANVRDFGGTLTREGIKLYVDGSEKGRFRYDPASGNLTYYVGRTLYSGVHEVRIEAESESPGEGGRSGGSSSKRWTFTVVRR